MPTLYHARFWQLVFALAALLASAMALMERPVILGELPDKALHVAAFVLLTILARLAFPKAKGLSILIGMSVLGGLIEVTQAMPLFSREASALDWAADVLAVVMTLGLLKGLQMISKIRSGRR